MIKVDVDRQMFSDRRLQSVRDRSRDVLQLYTASVLTGKTRINRWSAMTIFLTESSCQIHESIAKSR